MNAEMYPDADHSATTTPTIARTPAAPRWACRFCTPPRRISRAGPGVSASMFASTVFVVDLPSSPTAEMSTSSPGKMDWML
jgi:hypothetical protein